MLYFAGARSDDRSLRLLVIPFMTFYVLMQWSNNVFHLLLRVILDHQSIVIPPIPFLLGSAKE